MGAVGVMRRPRSLALELVEALGERIREGQLAAGDKLPTEAAIMAEYGVSRTVVREAISKLQATGLVETRHGVGTFVLDMVESGAFRVGPEQLATLHDVVALLELRIGIETEAAALAAKRRTTHNLSEMKAALRAFADALNEGRDAVGPDFQFHLEIARATQNPRYLDFMSSLGASIIPRARVGGIQVAGDGERAYLARANLEHESILDAIAAQDPDSARAAMRTHLANSRERRRREADALG
jgi:GntR family transcriptional regulator, transcriptional repressor for pyruvate dehydrogenase complex